MAQGILLDHTQVLEVTFTGDICQIIYGFHTFQSFHKDDIASLRVTVMQLITMGIKKTRLAKIFNIHRKTIEKWEKVFQEKGLRGLISMEKGRSLKCDEIIEKYIVDLDKKLNKQNGYKQIIINEVEKLFKVTISRETIRRVLNKHNNLSVETISKIENEKLEVKKINNEERNDVKNGGVLLALPLLEKYNISELIPESKENRRKDYSFKDIVNTLSMLYTGGLLNNEEQIKVNDSPCMGAILQKRLLPSLRTIRRQIPELIEKQIISKLKKNFAALFYNLHVNNKIFYIDGHFMPYHGKEKTLYGYNSLRRIAMKGRTSYVINTESGRPIYQILSDNFDNFTDNISKLIRFLKKINNRKETLLVFDRGGFGEGFFSQIYYETEFVCWYRGKVTPGRGGKWKKVFNYFESNIYGEKEREVLEVKEEKYEIVNNEKTYIFRKFFIRKGDKISVAISNDLNREIDELVRILIRRWGAQENVFKELKKIGYDNIHSYWKYEYSEELLLEGEIDIKKEMENPEYKEAVIEKRRLKKQADNLRTKIGKLTLKSEGNRVSKSIVKLRDELSGIEKEIKATKERIRYLPESILRFDYVKENKFLKLGSEKKEFFDLMKFITYNVRRDIADLIGPVYQDNRDIHTVILKWLKSKCILEKVSDKLIVSFSRPGKNNEYKALQLFCDYLNSLRYRHFNTGEVMCFQVTSSV